jgi:hypothetical protein
MDADIQRPEVWATDLPSAVMTLNRVWLLGHVGAAPRTTPDGALILLATLRSGRSGTVVERHLVRADEADASDLQTAALVLVEGLLTRDDARRRHVVRAMRMTRLIDPDPIEGSEPSRGTHASPAPHERVGHFRRVAVGTSRERLVWVRPSAVGQHSPLA